MRLVYVTRSGRAWDITEVFQSVAWSGDYQQAARKVELTLAWSDTDPDFPREVIGGIDNGEMFFLYSDTGDELFQGYVFSVSKTLGSTTRTFTAYDGLIYLVKSSIAANFQRTTAQGVTRKVAAEMGIPLGTMADDAGVATNFAHIGKPAYEAIMGAWTQVKKASGKFYLLRYTPGLPVMHGEDVKLAQARLAALGHSPGTIDGVYGPRTKAAVLAFQLEAFPSSPKDWDGIVGPKTWGVLNK